MQIITSFYEFGLKTDTLTDESMEMLGIII